MESNRTGYLSINEAAAILEVSPWEVLDLAEVGQLTRITLIDAASLATYKETA